MPGTRKSKRIAILERGEKKRNCKLLYYFDTARDQRIPRKKGNERSCKNVCNVIRQLIPFFSLFCERKLISFRVKLSLGFNLLFLHLSWAKGKVDEIIDVKINENVEQWSH